MKTKVIIYKQPDGSVAVCTPCLECGLTIEEIAIKDVPEGCPYKICNSSLLPQDGTFFDAWVYDENKIVDINVSKTHEIMKNTWRQKRIEILKKLDVQWMRALEKGDIPLTQEIANKKQILRDVTLIELPIKENNETIDQFSEKIKNIKPECLDW